MGPDPPLHTTNRQLLQPFFSPKELASLRDFAAARVAELSAEMQARLSFDFILDFVIPLTQSVSAQLLGLTTAERQQLQSSLPGHAYLFGYLNELSDFLTNYFQQHEPGAEPTMMGHLRTLIRAGQLSQAAAVSLTKNIWLASITTTSMLMSNAAQYLGHASGRGCRAAGQPGANQYLHEGGAAAGAAHQRSVAHDYPALTLGGQAIPAGATVVCSLAAANRDPTRYPNPNELDLRRRPARHPRLYGRAPGPARNPRCYSLAAGPGATAAAAE